MLPGVEWPEGARVTSALLWRSAAVAAAIDVAFAVVLTRAVTAERFRALKRPVLALTAVLWFGIWLWVVIVFWESVYSLVFPAWSRWYLPAAQSALTTGAAWLAFRLATKVGSHAVLTYLLLGGLWGVVTHIWAVYRGILQKPPLLQGAGAVPAVVFAFFEFTFYWCVIVGAAALLERFGRRHTP